MCLVNVVFVFLNTCRVVIRDQCVFRLRVLLCFYGHLDLSLYS